MTEVSESYGKLEGASTAEAIAAYRLGFRVLEEITFLHSESQIDLKSFRAEVDEQCASILSAIKYLAGKGNIAFLASLSNQEERFTELISKCGLEEANQELMASISSHFQISAQMLKAAYDMPEELYFSRYREILDGSEDPIREAVEFWKPFKFSRDNFSKLLTGLSITLDFVPSDLSSLGAAKLATLIQPVMAMASDRENIRSLASTFAENIFAINIVLDQFVKISGNSKHGLATFNRDIAMPAEFLAMLYAETQSKSVLNFAKIMLNNPVGYLPYTFFEIMGFDISREWHTKELMAAKGHKLIKLIEHAIMVPGYDIPIQGQSIGLLNNAERKSLIEMLSDSCKASKDNFGRVKDVLSMMRIEAIADHMLDEVEEDIVRSGIPAEVFADNKGMLAARFGNELGI